LATTLATTGIGWHGNRYRSTQCPGLLNQGLSLARGGEKNHAGVAFRVGPTRDVSPQPIVQIFKLFDVHRPTYPALTAPQTRCWRIYIALSFRAGEKMISSETLILRLEF
jgi:hypothetical protein